MDSGKENRKQTQCNCDAAAQWKRSSHFWKNYRVGFKFFFRHDLPHPPLNHQNSDKIRQLHRGATKRDNCADDQPILGLPLPFDPYFSPTQEMHPAYVALHISVIYENLMA